MNAKYRALLSVLLLLSLFPRLCAGAPARSAVPSVYVTSPWLASMAQFIVGATLDVQALSAWSAEGRLQPLRRAPSGVTVIALDPKDAARHGMSAGREGLSFLYQNLPVEDGRRNALFFDPSALPFLSQRLLIVLCELKPENYAYYQRRLAEFQSRLESTLEVGRSLLPEVKVLDLTAASGPWIRAALTEPVRPPDELWTAWANGQRLDELSSALAEAQRRSWWIVHDTWTPPQVRAKVTGQVGGSGQSKNILVPAPTREQDFFTYLHDIYLMIWSAMTRGANRSYRPAP